MGSGRATMGIRASCPPFRSLTLMVAPSLIARLLPWTLYDGVTAACMLSVTTEMEGGHVMRASRICLKPSLPPRPAFRIFIVLSLTIAQAAVYDFIFLSASASFLPYFIKIQGILINMIGYTRASGVWSIQLHRLYGM